jgi:hypothetical protein
VLTSRSHIAPPGRSRLAPPSDQWVVRRVGQPDKVYGGGIEALNASAGTRGVQTVQLLRFTDGRVEFADGKISAAEAASLLGVREQGLIDAVQRGRLYRPDPSPQRWTRAEVESLASSAWLEANRARMSDPDLRRQLSIGQALREVANPAWASRSARRRTKLCETQRHRYCEVGRHAGPDDTTIVEQACSCGAAREIVRTKMSPLSRVVAIRRVPSRSFDQREPT